MKLSLPLVSRLAQEHGDAFYILDSGIFAANLREMLAAFCAVYPDTRIAYSYKTNYIPALCRLAQRLGGFAEVVSEMEYELAERIGVPAADIYYNGPYKKEPFLRKALLDGANVNLDSLAEVRAAASLAREVPKRRLAVGLRCNFDIGTGSISRFGLDIDGEEFAEALRLLGGEANLALAGLHCHFPVRGLESFTARARGMTRLLGRACPPELRYVSFGGGYFGKAPQALADVLGFTPPSYSDYAAIVAGAMRDLFGTKGGPRLIIEPGSAVVADAMALAARVVSTKSVRGRHIATLAASRFNVNPSVKGGGRPMEAFPAERGAGSVRRWDIVGYTCVEDDCLYAGYEGALAEGDMVVIYNVGSYSVVFKPPFILPDIPVIDIANAGAAVVKRAETFADVFATFGDGVRPGAASPLKRR